METQCSPTTAGQASVRVAACPLQVTYPLDTLRLRIAVDPQMRSIRGASLALFKEGSYNAFFRGLGASLVGEKGVSQRQLGSQHKPLWRHTAARQRQPAAECRSALVLS